MPSNHVMKISVITPSYNQGDYIEETIKSIISQEGDFRLDYLVMDGGSTDNSVDIIRKYDGLIRSGEWPMKCQGISFQWASEKDNGQVDAIEKGLRIAKGDIACWLNSDDVLHDTGVLGRVVREFLNDPQLDMLTGDGPFIDKQGREFGVHHVDSINYEELLYLDYHILQPATFLSRNVFLHERLDRSYNYCFDAEYFIRLISKGYRYKKTNDHYACFRLYAETKTLSGWGKRYRESLDISRRYGAKQHYYLVSALYKYFDIVLQHKYSGSVFLKTATDRLRRASYKIITGKSTR